MSKSIEGLNFNKLLPHLTELFKRSICRNDIALSDIFILSDKSEVHLKSLIKKEYDAQKEKIGNI